MLVPTPRRPSNELLSLLMPNCREAPVSVACAADSVRLRRIVALAPPWAVRSHNPRVSVVEPLDRVTAVSYTHLDVYKRQSFLVVEASFLVEGAPFLVAGGAMLQQRTSQRVCRAVGFVRQAGAPMGALRPGDQAAGALLFTLRAKRRPRSSRRPSSAPEATLWILAYW